MEACRHLERGQGLFLFTDEETLQSNPDPLLLLWNTARENEQEALLDSLSPARPLLKG